MDPDALMKKAEESLNSTAIKQPRVNYLSLWLRLRLEKNGFGEDYDWTITQPRTTP